MFQTIFDNDAIRHRLTLAEKEGLKNLTKLVAGCEVLDYEMPVKGAGKLGCYVINPLSNHKNESRRKQLIDIYDSQIDGDKLDIWLKRQNTLSFLHSGNEICAEYYAVYDMFMKGIERIIEHINY